MKNIIFVAAPAAGKGTISAKVCTEYNIPHISTGDLLRNEIAASSKIGTEIKSAMARGESRGLGDVYKRQKLKIVKKVLS